MKRKSWLRHLWWFQKPLVSMVYTKIFQRSEVFLYFLCCIKSIHFHLSWGRNRISWVSAESFIYSFHPLEVAFLTSNEWYILALTIITVTSGWLLLLILPLLIVTLHARCTLSAICHLNDQLSCLLIYIRYLMSLLLSIITRYLLLFINFM